jgi:hypothetical protein
MTDLAMTFDLNGYKNAIAISFHGGVGAGLGTCTTSKCRMLSGFGVRQCGHYSQYADMSTQSINCQKGTRHGLDRS